MGINFRGSIGLVVIASLVGCETAPKTVVNRSTPKPTGGYEENKPHEISDPETQNALNALLGSALNFEGSIKELSGRLTNASPPEVDEMLRAIDDAKRNHEERIQLLERLKIQRPTAWSKDLEARLVNIKERYYSFLENANRRLVESGRAPHLMPMLTLDMLDTYERRATAIREVIERVSGNPPDKERLREAWYENFKLGKILKRIEVDRLYAKERIANLMALIERNENKLSELNLKYGYEIIPKS